MGTSKIAIIEVEVALRFKSGAPAEGTVRLEVWSGSKEFYLTASRRGLLKVCLAEFNMDSTSRLANIKKRDTGGEALQLEADEMAFFMEKTGLWLAEIARENKR